MAKKQIEKDDYELPEGFDDINLESLDKSIEITSYPKFEPRLDTAYEIQIISEISKPFDTKMGKARSINLLVKTHGKRHIIVNESMRFSLAKILREHRLTKYVGLECVLQKTKMKNKSGQEFEGINLYIK